ncbi:helix-turn-helix transcriptional regulator [Alcaligenaceae bacterium]|nr:helix-turn-helix transcriptional regulator [Alcaligenaceae bacterium]
MTTKEITATNSTNHNSKDDLLLARYARNCIEQHYGKLQSLSDLAALLRTDPAILDCAVQKMCGKNVVSLLAETRFLAAQRLLVQSSLTLNEISAAVGFEHTSEFAAAFHDYVGVNPWSFRQSPYHEIIHVIQGDMF